MKKRIIKYGGAVTGLDEERAIIRSIKNSRKTRNWQQAEEGALFEKELADYLGVKYGILTNSGSSAGLLALSALELPRGSEVIISAVTFPTIFNIILQCGLVPVVVDAKVGTYNFDVGEVEKAITKNTKAIIAIHALGNPCDMPRLMKVAKKHKLYVIEDNCDGWGSTIGGKFVGSFGDISFTSFHAAHIISMGVGGGVFTNDKRLAQNVRMYRDWGRQANFEGTENKKHKALPKDFNPRFIYEKVGYNFQILDLQAAMGRVQLKKAKEIKKKRKANFKYLYKHLSKFYGLMMPFSIPKADVCWFAFPLMYFGGVDGRGKLLKHLEKNGIETRPIFSGNILLHPMFSSHMKSQMKLPLNYKLTGKGAKLSITPYRSMNLKEANHIAKYGFWVSCHPSLTDEDLKYMVKVFGEFLNVKTP